MLFADGRVKRRCDYCGAMFRPRVPSQRYCRLWCHNKDKAAEGRAARRVWRERGRPMFDEREQEQQQQVA
jgi:hypothetical protein